jgi:hypothetical protein
MENKRGAEVFNELLKFICEEFMKPVDNCKKMNYLFSSVISSRFLQSPPDANGIRVESISYPSTKRDHKVTNMAIINSLVLERLDLVSVTVSTVTETNYDTENKNRADLMKISASQAHSKEFDFVNNKIIYDLERGLKEGIALYQESHRNND